MPASHSIPHRAPQPSPVFPTPARFQTDKLTYAKIRVVYASSEAVGDLIPQYREGNQLGVRIDLMFPPVWTPDGATDEESGLTEAGYIPVKEFHLSPTEIGLIERTGDDKVPYRVTLDRRNAGPFEPILIESADRP